MSRKIFIANRVITDIIIECILLYLKEHNMHHGYSRDDDADC
jgi:hypothetical protein